MIKNDKIKTLINKDIVYEKDFINDKIKTTNVNILLNRVRLDKKRVFKKRIFIVSFIFFFLGLLILIVS